jgi:DMSO reductase anchor subunit
VDYFFITGPIAVGWAIVVSLLGLTRRDFPGRAMPAVMVISAVLFAAGIVGAALGANHKAGERSGPPAGTPVAGHKNG